MNFFDFNMNFGQKGCFCQDEHNRDIEYMKMLCPKAVKDIQRAVDEECDIMEYDGSIMFDEYPDRYMLKRKCHKIYEKAVDNMKNRNSETLEWCKNLIEVMLYNEINQRRNRRRKIKQRIW